MVGWLLLIGFLVLLTITIPSGLVIIFMLIEGEGYLSYKIVFLVSLIFVILSIICFVVGYEDTRMEDCLNNRGVYSDIPGNRGCIYGGN